MLYAINPLYLYYVLVSLWSDFISERPRETERSEMKSDMFFNLIHFHQQLKVKTSSSTSILAVQSRNASVNQPKQPTMATRKRSRDEYEASNTEKDANEQGSPAKKAKKDNVCMNRKRSISDTN